MEDLLTSMIFGTLEHCDPRWVAAYLREARLGDGRRPLANLPDPSSLLWRFWPPMTAAGFDFCEPDVLIEMTLETGRRLAVLIEMKYLSGKSSFDDLEEPIAGGEQLRVKDQLAREWQHLQAHPADERWVIYITKDSVMPIDDVEAAQAELLRKTQSAGAIAWLSLRSLLPVLPVRDTGWLGTLASAMRRLDLIPFEGIAVPTRRGRLPWSFGGYDFRRRSQPPAWSFGFDWPRGTPSLQWRFER